MVLEVAILNVKENLERQFEADFLIAGNYISKIKGYKGHTLKKCIEEERKYILLVDWETLENHNIDFRTSDEYQKWKTLLHHYYEPFPIVEHYETIINYKI
ncbi:MAG: antibiotic biosynthesis monooxygenase [Winogradskyella sp.]|uniref:antibiotic biosynthesis monooxygenase family protein n=1 Tax=Winogradskyella sp. TaxID=1883156 RepID=UPI000F41D8BB|nr:antibiotic biosynthesis monooxygenase [Winogradskyella sp.]RNC88295.1 MAG: antibiotic biosynthesis monooxygenase [Winogradskyella sp.]